MKLIFALTFLLATAHTHAFADEGDDEDDAAIPAADVLLERDYPASAKVNALHVLIHKDGHLEGQPFVVEVSEMCPVNGQVAPAPRVIDVTSACDVAPNTLKFDAAKSELAVLIRQADEDGTCQKTVKRVVFKLKSACD